MTSGHLTLTSARQVGRRRVRRAEDGDREALSCRKTCNPGGSQDQVSSHPERTILTPPASLQHPIPEAQPGRILQVDETGAAPEATQLGKVAGIQAQSGSRVLAPALLMLKYQYQYLSISIGTNQAWEPLAASPRKRDGGLSPPATD